MMSRRERRIAWATGLVVGALALDRVLVSPLLARQTAADARVAAATLELTRADQLFQNELRARRHWKALAGDTLQTDAPQAESQLLNHVRQWAQQSGLTLTSLKPERTESEAGYGKITIRAAASGDMQSLGRFLYAVQTASIPVRVADVSVVSRRDGGDDELIVQMGLSTIYLPPAQPNPANQAPRSEVRR